MTRASEHEIAGLHHVTATVDGAQEDVDFYVGLLGLRLVKKTVNFDNNKVYHFYYGNQSGAPGTIMTTFPYRGFGVPVGTKGSGQIIATAFSVPAASIDYWQSRLRAAQVAYTQVSRFDEPVLAFEDPSTLRIELVGVEADEREPWTSSEIGAAVAIRGLHSVTLSLADTGATVGLLSDTLGFFVVGDDGNRVRLAVDQDRPGERLELLREPDRGRGANGVGTVHHVALAISDEAAQERLRADLIELGYDVSPVRDRKYFRSIYFRERGGVLIEVATLGPGFTVDEPVDALGRELKLPDWEEASRDEIERALPYVDL